MRSTKIKLLVYDVRRSSRRFITRSILTRISGLTIILSARRIKSVRSVIPRQSWKILYEADLAEGNVTQFSNVAMKRKSTPRGVAVLGVILLCGTISHATPVDYADVENLLPTEPQTTNDTLAAIVQDPVVQDAVQNAIGNGPLQGLVVKKKVLIMPATEPNKVVSQREQVLVVPVTHLEDVRRNITETANAETDVDGLVLTDTQSFTEDGENENTEDAGNPSYVSQPVNFNEASTEISKTMRKPAFPVDNAPQEIPYFIRNPGPEMADYELPAISVPIIAVLDPSAISGDKIDVPIAAALPIRDDFLRSHLNYMEDGQNDIQRDVESYADKTSWSVQPPNPRVFSAPLEIRASSSPYNPTAVKNRDVNSIQPETSSSRFGIDMVRPLFWTSDADSNYPTNPDDMDVAADIVFRPLFRYRQEAQQRSYRRSAYRRRNSYDSYPRRRYRPQYSDYY